jgi:cytochrome P450
MTSHSDTQPIPAAPPQDWRAVAGAMRDDALGLFPPEAFEEELFTRTFLGRRQFIINRPSAIQHVLIDNTDNYTRTRATRRILRPLLGRGLLLSEGEDWRRQRRTAAPAFAPRTVPLVARHVGAATETALARLLALAEAARPVDLLREMQSLTLEIAGAAMFSFEMARFGVELRELVLGYGRNLGRPRVLDFLLPMWLPTPHDLLRWRFRRRWIGLIGRIVAARRARGGTGEGRDLFDLLAAEEDPARLADQFATMIVAGHETTAVALFWALWLIAERPEVQDRLAAEAEGLDLGPDGAASSLARLVYAKAVIQETMRLYPPAFIIVRQALGDDVAGDIAIPRGGIAMIAPWVLHRHKKLWDEPGRFDPDRFLPGSPAPGRFAYLPFGIGPRVCIGAQFAMTEAVLALAGLARALRIERGLGERVQPLAVVTTQPDHPPLFRLAPRRAQPAAA